MKRLKRLAVMGALSVAVAVAVAGAASGASDTRWRLLGSQHARGEQAIARAPVPRDPKAIAVRFHGWGYVTWSCGELIGWGWKVAYSTGFSVLPSIPYFVRRQDGCVVEAVASHEWRASVAIYEAIR